MPKKALRTSLALAQTLRSRRNELGLTLREVVRKTREEGSAIPFSTLAKIERGQVDPGVRRLHQLLRLYHLPIQMAGDILDLEDVAGQWPAEADPETLLEQGLEHWRKGDTRKALAHLFAMRASASERVERRRVRQRGLLAFAVAGASLGKFRMSLKILEELLLEPLDPGLRVPAYVALSNAWDALGSADVALAFLERARHHLDPEDHAGRAMIAHKTGGVYCGMRKLEAARAKCEEAARAYRQAKDSYGESRLTGLEIRIHQTAGDLRSALKAATAGRRRARRWGFERLEMLRTLQEGNLLVLLGESERGLEALHGALARALSIDDRAAQFYAHYYLWRAHEQLGESDRARIERNAAEYFVQFVDEATEEVVEVRGERDSIGG